jgi:hypothetical protein
MREVPEKSPPLPERFDIEGVLDPYEMFGNRRTFRLCQIMVEAKMPAAMMDALIASQHADTVGAEMPLLVHSSAEVFQLYDQVIDRFGFRFQKTIFEMPSIDRKAVLFVRDPAKLAAWLHLNPATMGKVQYRPEPRCMCNAALAASTPLSWVRFWGG